MPRISKDIAADLMFTFISSVKAADKCGIVMEQLCGVADAFGFDSFAVSGIPSVDEDIESHVLLNGWPLEWFDRYVTEGYVHVDPVIYQAKTSDDAFVWSETFSDRPVGAKAKRLMNEAASFGMNDGFSVPLHMRGGLQGIVTFGAERIDLTPEARGVLQIIAIHAYNRLRTLSKNLKDETARSVPHITRHERDVIHWCAEGKTNWEIGKILGRSEKTVQHELHSAQRKLNCVNRAQLIAEAFRNGLIR